MPAYQFRRLTNGGTDPWPAVEVLFNDAAAIRRAIGDEFPLGCDVWVEGRYVGRFHRATVGYVQPVESDPAEQAVLTLAAHR